ncbi:MAG TPA: hypothetical protein VLA74_02955 [Nitrososphaeraceae archaeon]|nr:hypothetical protein [Nitrososphaeraceae archaeon]
MNKSYIRYIQQILNYNNKTFIMTSTLLALAVFMIALTSFSQSAQIASATIQDAQKIIEQGTVTSTPDPLPGHEAHQSITILRLKEGNPTYEGTLSFIASKPVEVQILHRNMTQSSFNTATTVPTIPPEFGTMTILPLPGGSGQVVSSLILPQYPEDATSFSASIPFVGNGLALHNIEGEEFVATYTIAAEQLGQAERTDDISISTGAINEDEDEDEEEEDN